MAEAFVLEIAKLYEEREQEREALRLQVSLSPQRGPRLGHDPSCISSSMARSRKAEGLRFTEPMECLPVAKLPDGDEWVYELLCCAQHNNSYVVSEIMLCRERFIRRHGSVRRS